MLSTINSFLKNIEVYPIHIEVPFGWLVFRPAGWFLLTAALFINQSLQYFFLTQTAATVFWLLFSRQANGTREESIQLGNIIVLPRQAK